MDLYHLNLKVHMIIKKPLHKLTFFFKAQKQDLTSEPT